MADEYTEESRGAGGTRGGVVPFFVGVVMAGMGAFLLTSRVTVTTHPWRLWGMNSFGLSLLPFLFGVGLLFFNGRALLGWLLTFVGLGIVFAGILLNLDIYFQPTSLFNTLMMLGLLAGGLGLVARSLRPWP